VARKLGLRPKAVIPVDLFGQPADHAAIAAIAEAERLFVIDDAAQAFGATYRGRKIGTFGGATGTSFFPAKPLGCYGDGGAVFTDDDELAEVLRSLRVHGEGRGKYDYVRIGLNGRFDTIQAAVLIEKLKIFP
jgi:dTDP-4-amino-4,6-dideoxygalactose transaminase